MMGCNLNKVARGGLAAEQTLDGAVSDGKGPRPVSRERCQASRWSVFDALAEQQRPVWLGASAGNKKGRGWGEKQPGPTPVGSKEDGLGISFRAEQGAAEPSRTQNLTHV